MYMSLECRVKKSTYVDDHSRNAYDKLWNESTTTKKVTKVLVFVESVIKWRYMVTIHLIHTLSLNPKKMASNPLHR